MPNDNTQQKSGRKLFFGLFIFPLLIAVGMAVLLCSVILLTYEQETPESLITAIKTGSPSKRWQKAFELSNELNRSTSGLRSESVMREVIHILRDSARYDEKTRGYMAIALSHFRQPESAIALRDALRDPSEEVKIYAMWSLGVLNHREATRDIFPFLDHESENLRKMAVYVLGVLGDHNAADALRPLLNDRVDDVRWNAALALARLGRADGLPVLLKMADRERLSAGQNMPEDQIEKILINATKGLALIPSPESIKILETLSSRDKSMKVRQAAIAALEYKKNSKSSQTDKIESLTHGT
jgi:HEAT repeat protein